MILQALCEYYQRKAADPENGIAPEGFEWKEIPVVVVIDQDGHFVTLEDTREGDGRVRRCKRFLVPATEKRTVGIKANLLWDNIEYVFGVSSRGRSDVEDRRRAFLSRLKMEFVDSVSFAIVLPLVKFLENNPVAQIHARDPGSQLFQEMYDKNMNVTFRVEGSSAVSLCETMMAAVKRIDAIGAPDGVCLVSGNHKPIARLHSSIKGVRGAQPSGASLVSFNLDAFESYRKKQNYNAPLSEEAAFAYTTSLNILLSRDSKNIVQVGDATTVFWAQKQVRFEDMFSCFFGYEKDEPDADVRAVKSLYDGIFTGHSTQDMDTRFYVLGLAPNAARLSVRFWHAGTIKDFAVKIREHFDDIAIIRAPKDAGHYSMFWVLSAISHEGKIDNTPHNLSGQIFESVITGGLYPVTLLQQALRRIRATQEVSRVQAGILKGCLNRYSRIYQTKEKEITVALDINNDNPGYRLGRLFAVLEKIQEEANPGINANIRDRFYGAASSTPVTVFPQLIKLKNHHMSKIDNVGRKINLERKLADIFDGIGPNMPSHLTMDDQARFAIGYYHQRQALFMKTDSNNDKYSVEVEK
jgi:CRISPR-associated protein Csd1